MDKWLMVMLAGWLVGCAGGLDDSADQQLDPEYGLIDWGRADDNSVVRPGSAEAEAVLSYVNAPVANQATWLVELDSKLNRRAAESLVNARSGVDGQIGTADDAVFETLEQLDAVRWVGRAALQQLFVLAEANGHFHPSQPCEEVLESYSGTTVITTMAHLIELENSRCDHFTGNVEIDVEGMILPTHRAMKGFDHVRSISGEIVIGDNDALDQVTFRGLEEAGRIDTSDIMRKDATFPALRSAKNLLIQSDDFLFETLEEVGYMYIHDGYDGSFPVLRKIDRVIHKAPFIDGYNALVDANRIALNAGIVEGFGALETGKSISVDSRFSYSLVLDAFKNLKTAEYFAVHNYKELIFDGLPALETVGDLRFGGSGATFPRLATAEIIDTNVSKTFSGSFPVLTTAGTISSRADRFTFPALEEVAGDYEVLGEGTPSPSVLRSIGGSANISAALSTYNALETIGGCLELTLNSDVAWDGMNRLDGLSDLTVVCSAGAMTGLDSLTMVDNISFEIGTCDVSGMDQVETTSAVNVRLTRGGTLTGLNALDAVEQLSVTDTSMSGQGYLNGLTLVDGELKLDVSDAIRGLHALSTVSENVSIWNARELQGLDALESVGGQKIMLPRAMRAAERDAFLSQLQQFSGTIGVH